MRAKNPLSIAHLLWPKSTCRQPVVTLACCTTRNIPFTRYDQLSRGTFTFSGGWAIIAILVGEHKGERDHGHGEAGESRGRRPVAPQRAVDQRADGGVQSLGGSHHTGSIAVSLPLIHAKDGTDTPRRPGARGRPGAGAGGRLGDGAWPRSWRAVDRPVQSSLTRITWVASRGALVPAMGDLAESSTAARSGPPDALLFVSRHPLRHAHAKKRVISGSYRALYL